MLRALLGSCTYDGAHPEAFVEMFHSRINATVATFGASPGYRLIPRCTAPTIVCKGTTWTGPDELCDNKPGLPSVFSDGTYSYGISPFVARAGEKTRMWKVSRTESSHTTTTYRD